MMKTYQYKSKLQGNILVLTENNRTIVQTQRLKMISLNQFSNETLIGWYSAMLTKPSNTAMFREGKPWTKEAIAAFVDSEMLKWQQGNYPGVFAVFCRKTQKFMGSLEIDFCVDEYKHLNPRHVNAAEVGYVLDEAFWGKGYGTELAVAAKKYVKFAHTYLATPVTEIVATVHPDNRGSKRILEKTLKRCEPDSFEKYGAKRLLFLNH